jgi:hypothetical protein
MGVDMVRLVVVKDERAHWSYGGFYNFRVRVAESVGIDLEKMEGYGKPFEGKPWDDNNPLTPFFNHSDCDGEWTLDDCEQIAPALRKILEGWPDNELDYDRKEGLILVEMMEHVIEEGNGRIELW